MRLRELTVERYKGYAERARLELAPLTILVGSNNSGKSALARAIPLIAGGLSPSEKDIAEPIPLESDGIRHGKSFEDLVTGRAVHGRLRLSADLADDQGDVALAVTVRNVEAPGRPSQRQISSWRLAAQGRVVTIEREGFDPEATYRLAASEGAAEGRQIAWNGLIPKGPDTLAGWAVTRLEALKSWAGGIRYLACPRRLGRTPFVTVEHSPSDLGPSGRDTPLALAADDELRDAVRTWYRQAFGVNLDVVAQGSYSELVVGAPSGATKVHLLQSGRGLSQVLPVAAAALTARRAGCGVDIIEHPEAELHPAVHVKVAELLLEHLVGAARPLVVETHSEMLLLRARRWIAEGKLSPDDVIVYWIHAEPTRGSALRRVRIDARGGMDNWPDGVFIEDYEEVLAIRRATRRGDNSGAS